jgi:hypothetical protein
MYKKRDCLACGKAIRYSEIDPPPSPLFAVVQRGRADCVLEYQESLGHNETACTSPAAG